MNWQMLGALGEIFGAIGVIATLGYLASQIRQGRKASQQAAVAELMDQSARFLAQLSATPEIARLWRLGMAADESLSIDEVVQFRALLMQLTYTWERLYYLGEAGHMDEWVVEGNAVARRALVGGAGFQAWFEDRKDWLSPQFRHVLESEIDRAPDYEALGVSDAER